MIRIGLELVYMLKIKFKLEVFLIDCGYADLVLDFFNGGWVGGLLKNSFQTILV